MSNAPKYIIYKCNVCDRQAELLLDGRRPDPLRCNITQDCRGKFIRIGERSAREFLFTPLVPGLSDYVPRGTSIVPAPQLTVPNPIAIFSGAGTGLLALSVVRRAVVGPNALFSVIDQSNTSVLLETLSSSFITPVNSTVRAVLFEISTELLTANKYTYVVAGPVAIVSGQDDSSESRNLRFTVVNNIAVYVNGVELASTAYDRTVDDQITFTPTIYDSNNVVEVFVYQDLSAAINNSKQIVLEFRSLVPTIPADATFRELDCWGNLGATIINNVERFILFCTDLSKLDPSKSYGVAYFETTSSINVVHKIKNSEIFILLGKEPFAFRDKELYAYLTGTSLIDQQSVITYKESAATGSLLLTVDDSAITQIFNPIRISRQLLGIQNAVITGVPGTALEGTENLSPKYILGPV